VIILLTKEEDHQSQLKSSQNISENKYFVNTKVVINRPSSLFLGGLSNGYTMNDETTG
jgi:16S rRNA U516 pseudouridylate synthase RsuA-like enzyme